ncbi:hypothetical protein HYS96_00440 [Candidatus Daviesbacteria bacterium]|nr:hypothetical protein [Candidatus Daviesbacteria bacterium]
MGNAESGVIRTPPIQEKVVPEKNLVANLEKLLYALRLVTHRSTVKGVNRSEVQSERFLSIRTTRAQLLKEFKSTSKADKEARISILLEAHARDEIAEQYLTQGEVKVNIPGLGEQSARYTIMISPESRKTPNTVLYSNPPIFLIPGLSNDIDCVGALAQEIAYMGRKVIVVGMPESIMGRITPEFAEAVSQTPGFGPHTKFFKGAINALVGENNQVELWGHSIGAVIIAEFLNDPKNRARVERAVLLNPASSANISEHSLNLGILNELRNLLSRNLPKYTLSNRGQMEQNDLKANLTRIMLEKVCTLYQVWQNVRVREGGRIIVYSGQKDNLTRSYELFRGDKELEARLRQVNPQMEVIDDPNGFHSTVLIEPQKVISQVFQKQAA